MASLNIDISEVRALASRLDTSGPRVGAVASRLLRRTGALIEREAKALVAVDTGALKNSISTTVTGDGRRGQMTVEIGPTLEYGPFQEFGTSRQPGKAYMGPAFDRHAPGYADTLAAAIEQDLL